VKQMVGLLLVSLLVTLFISAAFRVLGWPLDGMEYGVVFLLVLVFGYLLRRLISSRGKR